MGFSEELSLTLRAFIELSGCDAALVYTLKAPKIVLVQPKDGRTTRELLEFTYWVTRNPRLEPGREVRQLLRLNVDQTTWPGRVALARNCMRLTEANLKDPELKDWVQELRKTDRLLRYKTKTTMLAPLMSPSGELLGVCQLSNKVARKGQTTIPEFDARDERLMKVFALQVALLLENQRLLEEQDQLMEGFVNVCVTAVESRDHGTAGHSHRVADFTLALADSVNRTQAGPMKDIHFSTAEMREMRFAAVLHDIGKIGVNQNVLMKAKKLYPWEMDVIRMRLNWLHAEIQLSGYKSGKSVQEDLERVKLAWKFIDRLNEPTILPQEIMPILGQFENLLVRADGLQGIEDVRAVTEDERFKLSIPRGTLTPEERKEIESHVSHTSEILKQVPWSRNLASVAEIAGKHHEKLDGSGYPCGCKGDQIPLQSRIITICDIYDALAAGDRPYKASLSIEKSLEILAAEVGTGKLDRHLFSVFLEAEVYNLVKTMSPAKKKAS